MSKKVLKKLKPVYDIKTQRRLQSTQDEVCSPAAQVITPLFNSLVSKGYSPRDVAHLLIHEIFEAELMAVLDSYIEFTDCRTPGQAPKGLFE